MIKYIVIILIVSFSALAEDVVEVRKNKFQQNKDDMRSIYKAINISDFQTIISSVNRIGIWANKIPSYFPIGSVSRGASENIWTDFESFKNNATENERISKLIKLAAEESNISEINTLFSKLSDTCKSCHKSFKN